MYISLTGMLPEGKDLANCPQLKRKPWFSFGLQMSGLLVGFGSMFLLTYFKDEISFVWFFIYFKSPDIVIKYKDLFCHKTFIFNFIKLFSNLNDNYLIIFLYELKHFSWILFRVQLKIIYMFFSLILLDN